jgi:hypothetical protein
MQCPCVYLRVVDARQPDLMQVQEGLAVPAAVMQDLQDGPVFQNCSHQAHDACKLGALCCHKIKDGALRRSVHLRSSDGLIRIGPKVHVVVRNMHFREAAKHSILRTWRVSPFRGLFHGHANANGANHQGHLCASN